MTCQDLFQQRDAKQAEVNATVALVNATTAVLAAYTNTLQTKTMELNIINQQIVENNCT